MRILHTIYRVLRNSYIHTDTVLTRASNHHSFLLSAGITFNIFFAVLPMILTIVFITDLFIDSSNVAEAFNGLVAQTLPPNEEAAELLMQYSEALENLFEKTSSIGWVGIPTLIWIASALFGSIRTGLDGVFETPETSFFLKYKLRDVGNLIVLMVLLMASSFANTIYTFIESAGRLISPDFFRDDMTVFISNGAQFLVTALFFYLIFLIVPSKRQPSFVTNVATIICTILWVAAKFIFAWYTSNFASYGQIYGAYAVLVAVALWLYYSSLILLISAEIARYWSECRQQAKEKTQTQG